MYFIILIKTEIYKENKNNRSLTSFRGRFSQKLEYIDVWEYSSRRFDHINIPNILELESSMMNVQ